MILPSGEVNPEKRNISVTVTADGSNPISGVSVALFSADDNSLQDPIKSCTTGSAGGCTLRDVEDGTYQLLAYTTISDENYTSERIIEVSSVNDEFSLILMKVPEPINSGRIT